MDLTDLLQVGTVGSRNTLRLLDAKGRMRVVVGDDDGSVECFEVKRGEPISVYKVNAPAGAGPCQALAVGGKDRAFVAQGQTVVGLSRKGKQFFSLQSSLVEPIHHMAVDEAFLFTEYVMKVCPMWR